ncbi:putative mechanosensitive ion channel protein [Hamiltosporidium magnivora]|uniref:Putative mechanosensitive ion channel protein n=1 Tax=Hamiltosporidium magnivora TaxID=148818 RepID=A0A4Q9L445_9MICR|nr:putative mechanosensitive ion channel protein [Hamiltosporidium magnivora]
MEDFSKNIFFNEKNRMIKISEYENIKTFSYVYTILYFILAILFGIGGRISYNLIEEHKEISLLMFHIFVYLSIYFLLSVVMTLLCLYLSKPKYNGTFKQILVYKNSNSIKFIFGLVLYSMLIKTMSLLKSFHYYDFESINNLKFKFLPKNEKSFSEFIFSFSLAIFTFCLHKIVYQYAIYNMHYRFYRDKLHLIRNQMRVIEKIHNVTNQKFSSNIDKTSSEIFKQLSGDTRNITLESLKIHFDETDSQEILNFFSEEKTNYDILNISRVSNINDDANIRSNNQIQIKKRVFSEKYSNLASNFNKLSLILIQNEKNFDKLRTILILVFIPISICIFYVSMGKKDLFRGYYMGVLGLILPMAFVFGPICSEILSCIIFVFFVRPFDKKDTIEIENEQYSVKEIGISYSTLISDSRTCNYPNEQLRKNRITNIRKSSYNVFTISKMFSYESFKENFDSLKTRIAKYLIEHPCDYKDEFYITDFEITKECHIKVNFILYFYISHDDLRIQEKRKDNFTLFLHNLIKELNIVYF